MIGPAMYMNTAGLAPSTSSSIAQVTIAGAGTPPTSSDEPDAEPLALLPGPHRLLERLGQRHHMRVGIERRRMPVGLGERFGDRALGQAGCLGQHLAHRVPVEVGIVVERLLQHRAARRG